MTMTEVSTFINDQVRLHSMPFPKYTDVFIAFFVSILKAEQLGEFRLLLLAIVYT